MLIELPYGRRPLSLALEQEERVAVYQPRRSQFDPIGMALAAPIGSPPLRELLQPGETVAIVTSDVTRPCPSHLMLPPLLEELAAAGVRDEDILVVFALGSHRPHSRAEQVALAGPEVAQRVSLLDSDPEDVVFLGRTSRGTPVEMFRPVVEADRRIVLGNVEPHYFAGYSGGVKALVPGVCSQATIEANHKMMVEPAARAGLLDGNPVREDLEEAAALVGVDFMLNVILDEQKKVVAAAAGHPIEAHRWACRVVDYQSKVEAAAEVDLVIVSAGGYPKDLNLYQAQKALDNAAALVRPGGIIVWVAECGEGLGSATFEEWLLDKAPDSILARLQEEFVLGGHKAAAVARVLQKASIYLVSAMSPDLVDRTGLTPFASLQDAVNSALDRLGPEATVAVLPEGASVMAATATGSAAYAVMSQ